MNHDVISLNFLRIGGGLEHEYFNTRYMICFTPLKSMRDELTDAECTGNSFSIGSDDSFIKKTCRHIVFQ